MAIMIWKEPVGFQSREALVRPESEIDGFSDADISGIEGIDRDVDALELRVEDSIEATRN
jgi:hypothetical protein